MAGHIISRLRKILEGEAPDPRLIRPSKKIGEKHAEIGNIRFMPPQRRPSPEELEDMVNDTMSDLFIRGQNTLELNRLDRRQAFMQRAIIEILRGGSTLTPVEIVAYAEMIWDHFEPFTSHRDRKITPGVGA